MTTCAHIEEQLSAYLDSAVTAEEKKSIEEHLSQCEHCSLVLAELKKTQVALRNLEEVEPPPWFTQKIMNRVREEAESRNGFFRRLFYPLHIKIPLEAFATCLVIVLAVSIYKSTAPEMKTFSGPQGTAIVSPQAQTQKQYDRASAPKKIEGKSDSIPKEDRELQKKVMAPALSDSAGAGGPIKDMPHVPSPTGAPERLMAEKGFAETESRYKAKTNETDALKKQGAMPIQKSVAAPSAKLKEETIPAAPAPAAKDTRGGIESRPFREVQGTSAMEPKQLMLTVFTNTIETTIKDTEGLLNRFGAKNIKRGSRAPHSTVLDAGLPGQKVQEFFNALKTVGTVKDKEITYDQQQEYVAISIEITASP